MMLPELFRDTAPAVSEGADRQLGEPRSLLTWALAPGAAFRRAYSPILFTHSGFVMVSTRRMKEWNDENNPTEVGK